MTLTKRRPTPPSARVRRLQGQHHDHNRHYVKAYWPYLPILAVLALGMFVNSLLARQHHSVLGYSTGISSQELLAETNGERISKHRSALQINPQLTAAAQAKADDMAARGYWSHVTPDGKQPWNFMATAGYQYRVAGENLAYGFGTSEQITAAWMQSPEHRDNLLNAAYQDVGYATANVRDFGGQGPATIVVALYGEPANAADYTTAARSGVLGASTQAVSRLSLVSTSTRIAATVAIVCGGALLIFFTRHTLAWRRVLVKGERFMLEHPLFDVVLMSAIVITLVISNAAGHIL